MQLPKSQQTLLIVQSACIAGLNPCGCKLMQLRDLKCCLKENKFRNIKDIYHLQDGRWMLSRSFLHFSHLLFSEQHSKVHKAGGQRTGTVLLSQTPLRVGKLEPVIINSYSLWQQVINISSQRSWMEWGETSLKLYLGKPEVCLEQLCVVLVNAGDFTVWNHCCFWGSPWSALDLSFTLGPGFAAGFTLQVRLSFPGEISSAYQASCCQSLGHWNPGAEHFLNLNLTFCYLWFKTWHFPPYAIMAAWLWFQNC